jgi:uncharacterized repeat protein (TIGR01451 family)
MSLRRILIPLAVLAGVVGLAVPASASAAASDLAVSATAPATVAEEGSFHLVVAVRNNGPDDAQNVFLQLTIPTSSATFLSANLSQGTGALNGSTGELDVNFGTIANGNSANIDMTYRAPRRVTIETKPTVSFSPVNSQRDPDATNNAVTTDLVVTGLTAAPLPFGDQPLGTLSPTQVLTVTNNSSQAVTFGSLPVTGAALAEYFSFGNTCAGATLAAGASCTMALRFAPSGLGSRNAQIDFAPSSGPVDPLQFDLTGNGIPLPVDTGPAGAPGPQATQGPQGARGPQGPPAFKLALASAVERLVASRGQTVTLAYASTLKANVTLVVLKGNKRVATIAGHARQGSNRIRWNGRHLGKSAGAGHYVLRLTARNGRQKTTLKVRLTLH